MRWMTKMAWLKNKKQQDRQIAETANVTALASAPPSSVTAPTAAPGTARSLAVPASAISIAIAAVIAAGANWDSWVASQTVQSTDDAAVYADVSSVSARVSGTVEGISVSDYVRVKAGDLLLWHDEWGGSWIAAHRARQAREAAEASG